MKLYSSDNSPGIMFSSEVNNLDMCRHEVDSEVVRLTLKILQLFLQDSESLSDHFGTFRSFHPEVF